VGLSREYREAKVLYIKSMKKILFGLGNKGDKFVDTRHNLGAEVLRAWEKQVGEEGREKQQIIYPRGFMNDSGHVLAEVLRMSSAKAEDVLVLHDDMELPLGEVELMEGGSAKGHNGVRSIYEVVEEGGIHRLRLGIGRPSGEAEARDFVLSRFSEEEREKLSGMLPKAFGLIEKFVGLDR